MIEGFVQPAAPEGGAVAAFMPVGIAGGIEGAVDEEGRHGPPASPGEEGDDAAGHEQQHPGSEIGEARAVAAPHEGLQRAGRQPAAMPLPFDPLLDPAVVEGERILRPAR